MYPASRLVRPEPRPPSIVPSLLSLVAAIVLLVASRELFSVLAPDPPHLVQYGMPVTGCATRMGPGPGPGDPVPRWLIRESCHLVVPDQKIPQRVAVGVGATVLVGFLVIGAARAARRRPALA